MTKAIIFGKFCPLHNAHLTLIRATLDLADKLEFGLFIDEKDPIAQNLRLKWLTKFGKIHIIRGSYAQIDSSQFDGFDLVAGSNPKIPEVAEKLGAAHFMWDPAREALPIRSSNVLKNTAKHWHDLPDFVRISAQKRLTFVGPESVGKSFFAKRMAEKYGAPHVPEYGRPHEKYRGKGDYTGDELAVLARRHGAARNAIAHLAGPILFEDTDELMTAVWSEMLLGKPTATVEAQIQLPDAYVLYGADTPWEEDTLRYFAKQELRQAFFERIESKLKAHNAPYQIIEGDWQKRENETIALVEKWLSEPFSFQEKTHRD